MEDVRTTVRAEVGKVERSGGRWASDRLARALYLLFGLTVIVLVFRHLQLSTQGICCGDFDGYYHIKWSQLLWQRFSSGHLSPPQFTWLPLTTLNPNDYVDHHLFFHILQIPFTWFGDLTTGAKVAAIFYASLAVFSCYWLVVRYRISYALGWLVALLACSAPFLYRLNMAKAPPVAIIFMVIGIYLLFEKKYAWLAPLAFLFVWTYSLFVTLIGAAFIWTCVLAWSERRFEWRPFAYTLGGSLLGLVVNPYFPKNIKLLVEHVVMKARPGDFTISVGTEWYPYESWYLLGSCLVAFAAMLIGYIAYSGQERKRAARPLFLLIFSTLLMIASFRYRRFVEYWPPFAVLFAAFSLQPLFAGFRETAARLPSNVMDDLSPFFDRHEPPAVEHRERVRHWHESEVVLVGILLSPIIYAVIYIARLFIEKRAALRLSGLLFWEAVAAAILFTALLVAYGFWRRHWMKAFAAFGIAALCLVLILNVTETAKSISEDHGPKFYQGGMRWVQENVPPGQMVFNTDWDDFPKLFYLDTAHSYTSGLDPTYLLDQNPELSKLYVDITLGNEKDPGPLIRDRFGARYVFSDNEQVHDNFYAAALDSGWFDKVYEDDECTVLHIRDQKGEPPPETDETNDADEQSADDPNAPPSETGEEPQP